ncbi:hypothetical protein V3C99_007887 [Haemonchus contortus]
MEEDSEMAQSLADELESANQEFTGEADVNLTAELLRVKAIEGQRITERRKLLLTGQEPMETDSSHCDIRSDGLFVEWAARPSCCVSRQSKGRESLRGESCFSPDKSQWKRTPLTATSEAMDYSSSGQRGPGANS